MRQAYQAAKLSPDPSSQNGAIILSANERATVKGKNHIPAGLAQNYTDREYKYKHVLHAEHAAILTAAANGISTAGATMVCPWACCLDCARYIAASGIVTLVVHTPRMAIESTWDEQIKEAHAFLTRVCVQVLRLDGGVGGNGNYSILVSGRKWTP